MNRSGTSRATVESLFQKNYWDRPPLNPDDRGDQTVESIYCAVGHALTMWEIAEDALADVYLIMSEGGTTGACLAARRAFGAIETSSGRRRMLGEVAAVYFGAYWSDSTVSKPFKMLSEAFGHASHRRDDIAHGIAMGLSVNNEAMGTFLVPAAYNSARNRLSVGGVVEGPLGFMPGVFRYTATDINCFAGRFLELRNKTLEYLRDIRKIGGIPRQILIARGIDPAVYEASLAGR